MNNRYQPHVVIYPEDRATAQIAQGFVESAVVNDMRCEVFHCHGKGWQSVVEAAHDMEMEKYGETRLVLFIDLDHADETRIKGIKEELRGLPYHDRIYLIGSSGEAEDLRREVAEALHRFTVKQQDVGDYVARRSCEGDCLNGVWGLEQLSSNRNEISRLCRDVKDIVFGECFHYGTDGRGGLNGEGASCDLS